MSRGKPLIAVMPSSNHTMYEHHESQASKQPSKSTSQSNHKSDVEKLTYIRC